jgi:glutamine amidotransferase-like uncharacterized protein
MSYKVIPMTRLGLESYQDSLSSLFQEINLLLKKKKEIYRVTEKFFCKTERFPEGHYFFPGSLIIDSETHLKECKTDVLLEEFYSYVSPLKLKSKIAFLDGKNCAEFCSDPFYTFFKAYGIDVDTITDDQIRKGILSEYEILIVPGGPDAGESYYEGLGEKGFCEIRTFIENGGSYLGSCAGSYFPLSAPQGTAVHHMWLNMIPVTDKQGLDYWRTGTGFVRLEVENSSHPITWGLAMGKPSTIDMIYWEGPAFHLLENKEVNVIARYKDFIASGAKLPSWSLENNDVAAEAMKWCNPLSEERFSEHLKGMPAIIETSYGNGNMVLLSPHAEFGTCGTEHKMEDNPNYMLLMNSLYHLSDIKEKKEIENSNRI